MATLSIQPRVPTHMGTHSTPAKRPSASDGSTGLPQVHRRPASTTTTLRTHVNARIVTAHATSHHQRGTARTRTAHGPPRLAESDLTTRTAAVSTDSPPIPRRRQVGRGLNGTAANGIAVAAARSLRPHRKRPGPGRVPAIHRRRLGCAHRQAKVARAALPAAAATGGTLRDGAMAHTAGDTTGDEMRSASLPAVRLLTRCRGRWSTLRRCPPMHRTSRHRYHT